MDQAIDQAIDQDIHQDIDQDNKGNTAESDKDPKVRQETTASNSSPSLAQSTVDDPMEEEALPFPEEDFSDSQSSFPPEDPTLLAAYDTLSHIEQDLKDIREQHEARVLQHALDFSQQGPLGLVATTVSNREFLGYEDTIMKILLQLDTVQSGGDTEIRNERKRLVKLAESMLNTLDEYKQKEWERASSHDSNCSEDTFEMVENTL
ncbi:hypothetical protein BY458DRAFT_513313 [Sporodiniella umbellata]|nr:hypothetical protein BY458DRAFT_513313 [Sporodiniella umbellata]